MMLPPDNFDTDPYGYLTNQAGHAALVGMPAGVLLMLAVPVWLAPILVALIYAVAWEWGWQRWRYPDRFDWRDSVMDTACVMAGASILAGFVSGFWEGAACLGAYLALVFVEGLRRWKL